MQRRWFQIQLGTTLLVTLLTGVLLGVNLTERAQLDPLSLSIGRDDSSVPVTAYTSHTYRGWPLHWEEWGEVSRENIYKNAGVAAGLILLATVLNEVWAWRRQRAAAQVSPRASIAGLPLLFVTVLVLLAAGSLLAWHNSVLVSAGPFAVRGWPVPYQAYFRAEAVVTRETIQAWDDVEQNSIRSMGANAAVAALILGGVVLVARLFSRRGAPAAPG